MEKIIKKAKKEIILVASGLAAAISAAFVPPSNAYLSYIDFNIIIMLFCLMAIIEGIRSLGAFEALAQKMLQRTGSIHSMSLVLVLLTFFSSMFITNDVALITFVPFTIAVLSFAGRGNLIFVITMQTIAANLGSMLTPVGNPQNLYLYSFYKLGILDFMHITLPIVLMSLVIIVGITLLEKNGKVKVSFTEAAKVEDKTKLNIYICLFAVCLASVFGMISCALMFAVVSITILSFDRGVIAKVDYGLLITFVFFFIFIGNIAQISVIENSVIRLIRDKEMIFAIALSQVISNVPAAIMLSSFTKNYAMLIAGTNIGGLGSLIASLASLISFRLYLSTENAEPVKYLTVFTGINLLILPLLVVFAFLWY